MPTIEAALEPFEARPHWGKLFAYERDALLDQFERLDDALALIASYDPNGTFANPYLDRLT